jgi:hypothetical protein
VDAGQAVETVAAGLTSLADVDPDALSDSALDELLTALLHAAHRLDAQVCRVARRWHQRGVWCGDGSKSPAARMSRAGHVSQRTARTVLWRGRRLGTTPVVAAAFADGHLSADQVDLLTAAQADREAPFSRDEEVLVDQARRLRVAELAKALAYWKHRADAELNNDGAAPKLPTLSLTLSPTDGAVAITGELDPVGGRIVMTALDAIVNELTPSRPDLSPVELRAAAVVEMARRAMAMPADGRPARVLANIVLGLETFTDLCELSNGMVIRPGHLLPFVEALDIRTILYDATTRAVATSKRRTFVGSLRAIVEVRDRHCQHPSGCDEPIDRCDVDHIVP